MRFVRPQHIGVLSTLVKPGSNNYIGVMDNFFDIDKAASLLQVHHRTLRRAVAAKKLRAYKERCQGGFRYLFDPADLERYRRSMVVLEPTK